MIIWISGAYGVGKSTLAEALAKKMKAIVYDAEEVGNAVRGNYPGGSGGAETAWTGSHSRQCIKAKSPFLSDT